MNLARQIKISFARSASGYGQHAKLQREVSDHLIRRFAPDANPRTVLDAGCGIGFTALDVERRWPRARVVALDIAFPMAREAKQNGLQLAVTADAALPPFKERSFDAIFSSLAFQWIGSPHAAGAGFFHSLAALLDGGGLLAFSTVANGTLRELRTAYDAACMQCTGKRAEFPPFPLGDSIATMMTEVGFTELRQEHLTMELKYGSLNELFGTLKGIGAASPARPFNPARRDVLERMRALYPASGNVIRATYEIDLFSAVKK